MTTNSTHPDAYDIPEGEEQIFLSRGVVVMATTKAGDRPLAVPIFAPPMHSPAFQKDWKALKRQLDKCGKKGRASKLEMLADIFETVWQERVGPFSTDDQATIDNLVLYGNALIDQVPLRHVVLVTVGARVEIIRPPIANRDDLMVWKDEVLPGIIKATWGPNSLLGNTTIH